MRCKERHQRCALASAKERQRRAVPESGPGQRTVKREKDTDRQHQKSEWLWLSCVTRRLWRHSGQARMYFDKCNAVGSVHHNCGLPFIFTATRQAVKTVRVASVPCPPLVEAKGGESSDGEFQEEMETWRCLAFTTCWLGWGVPQLASCTQELATNVATLQLARCKAHHACGSAAGSHTQPSSKSVRAKRRHQPEAR